jgi:hypothetical protein
MPIVLVKTTPERHVVFDPNQSPTYVDPSWSTLQRMTAELMVGLPTLVRETWNRLDSYSNGLLDQIETGQILPDLIPPFNFTTDVTPDLSVVIRPIWTRERANRIPNIKESMAAALKMWFGNSAYQTPDRPYYEVDIDFQVGGGMSTSWDGRVLDSW